VGSLATARRSPPPGTRLRVVLLADHPSLGSGNANIDMSPRDFNACAGAHVRLDVSPAAI
jgi:hypothetical protein